MKSNCLIFSFKKFYKEGGYLIIRRSHYSRFIPHFMWSPDLKDAVIEQYVPVNPKHQLVKILFHKILFEGYIKTDDK